MLGAEHPATLTTMGNLVLAYTNRGRWKEGEELGVQAVGMTTRALGAEHQATLTGMSNLAFACGWQREAEQLELQVIETRKRVLGVERRTSRHADEHE